MLFKRKQKQKDYCKHEWELIDYYDDLSDFDIDKYFEICCPKCEKIRTVDDYTFDNMTRRGLIKK